MGKAEHALALFIDLAQGRVDAAAIGGQVEALIGLLARLDHDERWEEALRVARSLAMLLALLGRWLDLLQSLQVAVSAAEQLGDDGGKAWALHELGTLHLVAGKHSEANRLLGEAHELREQIGDRRGLAVTDRNLQILCRALRALLPDPPSPGPLGRLLRIPVWALVVGMSILLAVGGVAGAIIRGAGKPSRPLLVGIEATPASPRLGGHVAFRAVVKSGVNPGHYAWRFGDGEASAVANPTHVYRYLGPHTVSVRVSGVHGTGEGTRTVIVRSAPPPQLRPHASFSSQPPSPFAGEDVSFDAGSSSDPNPSASIASYIWRFGDGHTGTGLTVTHRYAEHGTYHAELLVADTRGASATAVHEIVIREAPGPIPTPTTGNLDSAPEITSADSATFPAGTEGSFSVVATGTPRPTISEEGRLPEGVSFAGHTFSGTPTQPGTYSITLIATNGVGDAAKQPFTLTVSPSP
jgi:PKD repeat protein